MSANFAESKPLLDVALVASLLAFGAILINRPDLPSFVTAAILIALTVLITIIGVRRENTQMDEVQLAAANFGSRWSITVVVTFMLLLCFFAPLQDSIAAIFGGAVGAGNGPIPGTVLVFISGLLSGLVVLLAAKFALTRAWLWSKR